MKSECCEEAERTVIGYKGGSNFIESSLESSFELLEVQLDEIFWNNSSLIC